MNEDDLVGAVLVWMLVLAACFMLTLAGMAFRVSLAYGCFVLMLAIGVGLVAGFFVKDEIQYNKRRHRK